MSEFDLHSNIDNRVALTTRDITTNTTTVGENIDTSGFESVEFIVQSGAIADGVYVLLLEEGDDAGLSDAAPVSADETLGSLTEFTLTGDDFSTRVGSIGKKRFQRLSIVSTGTSSGGTFSAIAALGHPHTAPVPVVAVPLE